MTYFCFLDSDDSVSTYMQPLDAETPDDAIEAAIALLMEHQSQVSARVYLGDHLIATLPGENVS